MFLSMTAVRQKTFHDCYTESCDTVRNTVLIQHSLSSLSHLGHHLHIHADRSDTDWADHTDCDVYNMPL